MALAAASPLLLHGDAVEVVPDAFARVPADALPARARVLAQEVILCTSELAANAALHSDSARPGGEFTIRVKVSPGDYAWIEVEDNGGPWITTVADSDRGSGRGLDIIRALAADWGIDGDHHSRTVWVRLDWPAT
jgi:two-component sensor histidine kinase